MALSFPLSKALCVRRIPVQYSSRLLSNTDEPTQFQYNPCASAYKQTTDHNDFHTSSVAFILSTTPCVWLLLRGLCALNSRPSSLIWLIFGFGMMPAARPVDERRQRAVATSDVNEMPRSTAVYVYVCRCPALEMAWIHPLLSLMAPLFLTQH